MKLVSGIYEIVNTLNGKQYIGSAVNFAQRWHKHRSALRDGKHRNIKLQRSWDKYGEVVFEFRKLIICEPSNLLFYEQRFLDALKPEFNIFMTAGSALGWKHTEESRAKLGVHRRGIRHSEETKAKISAAKLGKKLSEEHRAKLAGKVLSDEHKAKIGAASMGRAVSKETRAKLSVSLSGKVRSAEHSAKLSAIAKGRVVSDETKKKQSLARTGQKRPPEFSKTMSEALKGRKFSDEWRAKLSAAAKLRAARVGYVGRKPVRTSNEATSSVASSFLGTTCE
jgi:group I intron endonuclease